jgi:hypothetical protein
MGERKTVEREKGQRPRARFLLPVVPLSSLIFLPAPFPSFLTLGENNTNTPITTVAERKTHSGKKEEKNWFSSADFFF